MQKPDETREFTRLSIPVKVEVKTQDNKSFSATADNVSMNGILLHSDQKLAADTLCEIRIILGEQDPLIIVSHGKVVRTDKKGIAITFTEMDLEGFPHMKNLLLLNASNTGDIENEFSQHAGLHRK